MWIGMLLCNERDYCSEVFIEVEVTPIFVLVLLNFACALLLVCASHDAGLLVVANTLLEEVRLAGQRDRFHEVERVAGIVEFGVAKRKKKSVRTELDVLLHERGIHAQQSTWQSVCEEFLLDGDCLGDDILNGLFAWPVFKVREEKTGEVGVKALVSRDQFVREGQARHQATLLQPEDGRERAGEEDSLYSCESDQTLGEGRVLILNPLDGPIGLLADTRD